MPHLIFAPAALRDLERLRRFLHPKNPLAAKRAAAAIIRDVQVLRDHPRLGRPMDSMAPQYRELLIDFGDSGYIVLYRYDVDLVSVLAVRHQKESGYGDL